MIGAQASNDQLEKILSYVDIGKKEGAKLLVGGERAKLNGELQEGYYVQPTVFQGHNKMRIFQEEIFGPVLLVTTFKDEDEALAIANDTLYGLGSGVWTAISIAPIAWAAASRPGGCGPIATTSTRLTGLRRLQEVRHRARDAQDDARPLPADQERAGELQPEGVGLFLIEGCTPRA